MSELQISPAVLATVGCTIMSILAIVSAVVFYKKEDRGDNPGTVLSIIFGAPFFFSLCYLLSCIMEKVGKSI